MAMNKDQKKQIVADLASNLGQSGAIYVIDYAGLKVMDDNAFRKTLTLKGITYRAVKNTLLKRAFAEVGVTGIDKHLAGVTSVLLGSIEDPMGPAKELVAFLKVKNEVMRVKVIHLDGQNISGNQLESVSKMPGRKELIAKVVSMILGPGASLVAAISGPGSTVAGQVKTIEEKTQA
jgi:large subunit ribosomal protein L10